MPQPALGALGCTEVPLYLCTFLSKIWSIRTSPHGPTQNSSWWGIPDNLAILLVGRWGMPKMQISTDQADPQSNFVPSASTQYYVTTVVPMVGTEQRKWDRPSYPCPLQFSLSNPPPPPLDAIDPEDGMDWTESVNHHIRLSTRHMPTAIDSFEHDTISHTHLSHFVSVHGSKKSCMHGSLDYCVLT